MGSKLQHLKHFLSLPTMLILFLTSSIASFIVVSNFSNWTILDSLTGYGYGYGYGYNDENPALGYYYDYGYGYDPDSITSTGSSNTGSTTTSSNGGGCSSCGLVDVSKDIKLKKVLDDFSNNSLSDEQKESIKNSTFDTETTVAYLYAKMFGITTIGTIEEANPEGGTTRAQLAKMMVQFAGNVLDRHPDPARITMCSSYADFDDGLGDLKDFIIQACASKIMGLQAIDEDTPLTNFIPNQYVTRGEILTVLGRLIFDNRYKDMNPYYAGYMDAFYNAGIIKVNDPSLLDIRAHIWIILQRTHTWLTANK